MPPIAGTTDDPFGSPVTLEIFAGSGTGGSPLQTRGEFPLIDGTWEIVPETLPPGEYTLLAEQVDDRNRTGNRNERTGHVHRQHGESEDVSLEPVPTRAAMPRRR